MKFVVKRRLGSVIPKVGLIVALVVSGFGVMHAYQGQANAFTGEGAGKFGDPYLITNCEELQSINDTFGSSNKYVFQLANDIDCSETITWNDGAGFVPIGLQAQSSFGGVFDGNGHVISDLYINRPTQDRIALFSSVDSFHIGNVTLQDVSITGNSYVAAIAGSGSTLVATGVHVTGQVSGTSNTGGLGGSISNGYSATKFDTVSFDGTIQNGSTTGGIVGNFGGGSVSNAYVNVQMISNTPNQSMIGGAFGYSGNISSLKNIYVTGGITGEHVQAIGGLAGGAETSMQLENVYVSFDIPESAQPAGTLFALLNGSPHYDNAQNVYQNVAVANGHDALSNYSSATMDYVSVNEDGLQPNYHFDQTELPMSLWDTSVWQFTGTSAPTLRSPLPMSLISSFDTAAVTYEYDPTLADTVRTNIEVEIPQNTNVFPVLSYQAQMYESVQGQLEYRAQYNSDWSDQSDTTITGYGMRPGSTYVLDVETYTYYGTTSPYRTEVTVPYPTLQAPANLEVATNTNNQAAVTFAPVDGQNAEVATVYVAEYKKRSQSWAEATRQVLEEGVTSFQIENLEFEQAYDVRVKAATQYTEDPLVNIGNEGEWAVAQFTGSPFPNEDDDAVPDHLEIAAPNNGDANYDGIADVSQPNVASVVNPLTDKYVTLVATEGCTISKLQIVSADSYATNDAAYAYTNGFVDFDLTCGANGFTADVEVLYRGVDASGLVARKHNPNTNAYFSLAQYGAKIEAVTRGSDSFLKLSYQVTDGGILDVDGIENGVIVDPVGLARQTVGVPNTGFAPRK